MNLFNRLAARVGTFPVEIPAALLAAAAAAFWAGVAPLGAIDDLLAATGLRDLARLLLAIAAAALTFALAWRGLRALEPREDLPAGYPTFRREDLHPDAPRRRPILAGEEFGTPEPLEFADDDAVFEEEPILLIAQPIPAEPEPDFDGLARAVAAAPAPPPVPEQSVPELMARLERGLAARGDAPVQPAPDDETAAALRAIADELRQVARAG